MAISTIQNLIGMQESKDIIMRHNLKIGLSASLLLAATAAWTYRSLKNRQRLRTAKQQIKNKSIVQNETIIIAFEPLNLFVRCLDGQKNCYSGVKKGMVGRVINFFKGKNLEYQPNVSGKDLRKLFSELKQCQNVRLMIYTKLKRDVCLEILQSLGVLNCFEKRHIIHMQHDHKSAEEVDHDTRRVVVISALKEDQTDSVMSNNHNLVLDIGQQRLEGLLYQKVRNFLFELAKRGRADTLHEEMNQLAIQLELPLWNEGQAIDNEMQNS